MKTVGICKTSYESGSASKITQRLSQVVVAIGAVSTGNTSTSSQTIHQYSLKYQELGAVKKSQLVSIEQCDGMGLCLPEVKLVSTLVNDVSGTFSHKHNVQGDGDGIWNKSSPLTGDVNGDGLTDLIFPFYDNGLVIRTKLSNGLRPLLSQVIQAKQKTTFTYEPLTNNAIYSKKQEMTYPIQEVQSTQYVVSKITQSDGLGIGDAHARTYTYEGKRRHMQGLGDLGLR